MDDGVRPGTSFGKYRLVAHLASGGMADIFLASLPGVGGIEKPVVIKRILPRYGSEERYVNMLLDEASIASRLNHRNIIQTLDVGIVDGQHFIATEFLDGEDLARILKNRCLAGLPGLPLAIVGGIIMQVAEGLHYAHSVTGKSGRPLGLVHRDISPHNVFVVKCGIVKILDFGVALAENRLTETMTNTIKGKAGYMSPEQALALELDSRSDIFSLGIVMWECLTGRRLYKRVNEFATLDAIVELDAPSPMVHVPEIPDELAAICLRALARDREARYQSAGEMRADINSFLREYSDDSDTAAIGRFFGKQVSELAQKTRKRKDHIRLLRREKTGMSRRRFHLIWVVVLIELVAIVCAGGMGFLIAGVLFSRPDAQGGEEQKKEAIGNLLTIDEPQWIEDLALNQDDPNPTAVLGKDGPQQESGGPDRDHPEPKMGKRVTSGHKIRTSRMGLLRLKTEPWTNIYFRGKLLGQTPLVDVKLPIGAVVLRAVNGDAGIDTTIRIHVTAGGVENKVVKLR